MPSTLTNDSVHTISGSLQFVVNTINPSNPIDTMTNNQAPVNASTCRTLTENETKSDAGRK